MWLLSIVPGLCVSPLLVVSACITCSPPTLPTLLEHGEPRGTARGYKRLHTWATGMAM